VSETGHRDKRRKTRSERDEKKKKQKIKMTDKIDEKLVRTIPFDGEQSNWRMWSQKHLARAAVKALKDASLGLIEAPLDGKVLDPSDPSGKVELKARTQNQQARGDLSLCMDGVVVFGAADEARAEDLPDGDAAQAQENLMTRCEPKTAASLVDLKREFANSKLKSFDANPDEWFTELEAMRQKMKDMDAPMKDLDLAVHVLNNLPDECDNIAEQCEAELGEGTLPIKTLRTRLKAKWTRKHKDNADGSGETALAMGTTHGPANFRSQHSQLLLVAQLQPSAGIFWGHVQSFLRVQAQCSEDC
jgi:hypothetical protein